MRSISVNNNLEINSHQQPRNINEFDIISRESHYSLSKLEEMISHQEEEIKYNQQFLLSREQRLKYLTQQETLRSKCFKHHLAQQEMKHFRLKTLQNQIDQQKTSNRTSKNEIDILKQIFLNKENELTASLSKLEELTKQLEQIKRLKIITTNEQFQHTNQLEKLKQEFLIRNQLNEQQNRQINSQREIYAAKQIELNQLNDRIEEIQQQLKKKTIVQTTVVQPITSSANAFRTGLDTVQNTLNNINIAEIEKRMVQLANSFNSIYTNEPLITNQNDLNTSKKTNSTASSNLSCGTAIASITHSSNTLASPQRTSLPIIEDESTTDLIDSLAIKSEEQFLPANLRLNDDILSVHLNNVTNNIKKRYSPSDPCDSSIKYLSPIQVRDDFISNSPLSNTEATTTTYENLLDFQSKIDTDHCNEEDEQTIIESLNSDTQSEGSLSDDRESSLSFPITLTTSMTTLKSLLKTSTTPKNTSRRVIFDPLALLLDSAVIGDVDLVVKCAKEVKNPSEPNDEGLTALHNAVCAANIECVKFLVEFGCDINYADNDGWTPLHCAASCNHTLIVEFLIKHGACIYATTIRDNETAVDKCEVDEENYTKCSQYLLNTQNELGVINDGLVYALYHYDPDCSVNDELEFRNGDQLRILRRGDENESEWWWVKHETTAQEGYVPRNYLGLYPRVRPGTMS